METYGHLRFFKGSNCFSKGGPMETYGHLRFSGGPIASQREVLWKPMAT